MFWKRTTTTTDSPIAPVASQAPTAVPVVPVAGVPYPDPANATVYNPPYPSVEPVAAPSAATASVAPAAIDDQPLRPAVKPQDNYTLGKITQLVWLAAVVLESLFAIRFILNLIAANPAAGFDKFIANSTALFLTPFVGLLNNPTSGNGSVLEVTTLIAMLVYAILAWGIARLLGVVFERRIVR